MVPVSSTYGACFAYHAYSLWSKMMLNGDTSEKMCRWKVPFREFWPPLFLVCTTFAAIW